jgi:UDP-glucose 4-epimerase
MRAIVTGGTGVIGSQVVRALLARGVEVVVTSTRGRLALLADLEGRFESRLADVRDTEAMERLVGAVGPDVVVHLAAALPGACEADPVAAAELNVTATAALYEAAARAGARRFVYGSSKSAYGELAGAEPVTERAPARPLRVYDVTKHAGELLIAAQARRGGPEAVSLRFATIYGPGKAERHTGAALLSRLIEDAIAGRPVRIERGGDQVDDMIWVGDAAAGVAAAALAPGRLAPLYNLSTGVPTTLREFAAGVGAAFPTATIEVGGGDEYMGPDFIYGVLDPSLARRDLGFEADPDPARGAKRYAAALELLRGR